MGIKLLVHSPRQRSYTHGPEKPSKIVSGHIESADISPSIRLVRQGMQNTSAALGDDNEPMTHLNALPVYSTQP